MVKELGVVIYPDGSMAEIHLLKEGAIGYLPIPRRKLTMAPFEGK